MNYDVVRSFDLSRNTSKPTCAQSDQSSLCACWVANAPIILLADSEDSHDQTGRMPRLIFTGIHIGVSEALLCAHIILLVLSCAGSFVIWMKADVVCF